MLFIVCVLAAPVTLGHMAMLPVGVALAYTRMIAESAQIGSSFTIPVSKALCCLSFHQLILWEEEMLIKKLPSPDCL